MNCHRNPHLELAGALQLCMALFFRLCVTAACARRRPPLKNSALVCYQLQRSMVFSAGLHCAASAAMPFFRCSAL